jgi:hypothetical protein
MFSPGGTYREMCAYLWGFDAGTHGGLLVGFATWVRARIECKRPELVWSNSIANHALERDVSLSAMTPEENKTAIAVLFALLDEYLALGDVDHRAEAAFGQDASAP